MMTLSNNIIPYLIIIIYLFNKQKLEFFRVMPIIDLQRNIHIKVLKLMDKVIE